MSVTREQVLAKAAELGVTLSDTQIEQYVAADKLPEKKQEYAGTSVDDLVTKYTPRQLAELVVDTRGEAKEHRLKARELKEQAEKLTTEMNGLKDVAGKYPELETKFKGLETQLQTIKETEKKRREAALAKVSEEKRASLGYLLNVDAVPAESFDGTVALITGNKSNGVDAPSPGGDPPKVTLTASEKADAARLGLSDEAYAEVQKRRKQRQAAS